MSRVIKHSKRYVVQRDMDWGWDEYTSSHFLWRAKQVARYGQSLGYFDYRVIDTKEDKYGNTAA